MSDISNLNTQERGTAIETYGLDKTQVFRRIAGAILSIIIGIGMLAFLELDPFLISFENIAFAILPFPLFGFSLQLLLPTINAIRQAQQTTIYAKGIARNDNFVAWQDITAIKGKLKYFNDSGREAFKLGAYTLYQDDQALFQICGYDEKAEEQFQHIKQALINTHAQSMIDRVRNGETLHFGELALNADGIHIKNNHLSLPEVLDIRFNNDFLEVISTNGKAWKSFQIESFYSPHLFQAVLKDLSQNP